jgi:hypothetical protein
VKLTDSHTATELSETFKSIRGVLILSQASINVFSHNTSSESVFAQLLSFKRTLK